MQIEIDPSVCRRLKSELRWAGRREIGGVLMGEQLAAGHFRVVDLSMDTISGSAVHFVRNEAQHVLALEAFFERTGSDYARYNYLGEWHSHPSFPVRPSPTDVSAMTDLVEGERNIVFAALLIVRLDMWLHLRHSISVFIRGQPPQTIQMR